MTPAVLQKVYMNQFLSMNPNYMNSLKKSLEMLSSAKGETIDINQIQKLNQQPTTDTVDKNDMVQIKEPVQIEEPMDVRQISPVGEDKIEEEEEEVQIMNGVPEENKIEEVKVEEMKVKEVQEIQEDDEEEQLIRKMYEKMQKGLSEEREILEGPKHDPNGHYFYYSPEKKPNEKQIEKEKEEEPTKIEIQEISPVVKSIENKKKSRIEFDESDNEDTSQMLEKKLSSRTTQIIESKLAQKEKTVSREMLKNSLLKSKSKKPKKPQIDKEVLKNMTKIAKKIPKNKKELFKMKLKYDLLEKVMQFYN